ncbi:MAG: hypothetical protein ACR2PS_08505 [Pseudomonadales bacterium]
MTRILLLACLGFLSAPFIVNASSVDLSQDEHASVNTEQSTNKAHVLSNPWWQNFDLHGFAAVGFYDTGKNGTRQNGGFEIKEASLFVHADVWQDIEVYLELQTNRLGKDDQLFTRTGEVYLHFRNLFDTTSLQSGVKVGRVDIPFGEEYLWQDAIDNPLITNSASYVYGWDEGVLAYGKFKSIAFVAAITDGTDERSQEDHDDKAVNLKFYGNLTEELYLSFSAMRNGAAGKSAVEFGGSHFQPVGASHESTLGSSASEVVDGSLFQFDARYTFSNRSYVSAHYGWAQQDDDDSRFERDFRWFGVEPYLQLNNRWYVVARYSEIGTDDRAEGYHFDGKTFAAGNSSFGYDTKQFRRLGVGVGYQPNPRVKIKLELGNDSFDLIDGSPFTQTDDREFAAFEIAVRI